MKRDEGRKKNGKKEWEERKTMGGQQEGRQDASRRSQIAYRKGVCGLYLLLLR